MHWRVITLYLLLCIIPTSVCLQFKLYSEQDNYSTNRLLCILFCLTDLFKIDQVYFEFLLIYKILANFKLLTVECIRNMTVPRCHIASYAVNGLSRLLLRSSLCWLICVSEQHLHICCRLLGLFSL